MQAPPAGGVPLQAPVIANPPAPLAAVAPTTYHAAYTDQQYDTFQGNYVNLYNEYATGNVQPLPLRNSVYRAGNGGTFLHCLVHVLDPTAGPDDPGRIIALHRLTRHDVRFGQLPLPYDGLGLAYFGDVYNGQVPTTVTIPDTWYNQIGPVQVPDHGLLAQEMAANPNGQLFGPYQAGQADVQPVTTRALVLVPNCYAAPFLTTGMTPKDAYVALRGMIQQAGQDVACEPLLDWLRVTMTRRQGAVTTPATMVPMATPPTFPDPHVQQQFLTYRVQILHRDFPQLQAGSQHHSAVLIAQGISTLTDEQRLARLEAQQRQAVNDAPKKPSDFFGTRLDRLLRWCQVNSEVDLPPIYAELAQTKKGKIRVTLQTAMEEALDNLHYVEDFPLSTTMATKIQDLKWSSAIPDNFSLGVHLFTLGTLDVEAMEAQRQINQHADALYSGDASPALLDIVTVHDNKQDVCIPRTFAQLRYLIERSEALWLVLLGSQHPVTLQHRAFRNTLVSREQRLELISTRDQAYRHMVPALLGRVVQIEVNHWLTTQARTAQPVPFANLTDVFHDIDRQRPWEPVFPPTYLSLPKAMGLPAVSVAGDSNSSTAASTLTNFSGGNTAPSSNASASAAPPPAPSSAVLRNPAWKDSVFGQFKAMNIKAKAVKEQVRKNRVAYPTNKRGDNMCITYHALGICNENCRMATDHI